MLIIHMLYKRPLVHLVHVSMCQVLFFLIELEGLLPLQNFIQKGGSEITKDKPYRNSGEGLMS